MHGVLSIQCTCIISTFLTSCSTIMVATSKDMLHNDEEVTKRKQNVYRQVRRRAEELRLAKVLYKEFIDVNATVDDDNTKVRSEFEVFNCIRIVESIIDCSENGCLSCNL